VTYRLVATVDGSCIRGSAAWTALSVSKPARRIGTSTSQRWMKPSAVGGLAVDLGRASVGAGRA
jgi:hypothetical protein